jgi:hypothetical protein
MKVINRSAITIYGTETFLKWIKENHKNLHGWTLDDLNHHPNVYLIDVEDQNVWGKCFEGNFEKIFRSEVGQFIYNGVDWPKEITLELYRSWFRFEYSECIYDLSDHNLDKYDE